MEPNPTAPYSALQNDIYLQGLLSDQRPALTTHLPDLEATAREVLAPEAFGYVAGGSGSGATVRANREAFERRRMVPRMLRDVSTRELSRTVLGTPMPAPLMLAPVGVLSILHEQGEKAVARAAARTGVPMIHSTAASHPLEEVAEHNEQSSRWFQLYWPKDRDVAVSMLERAAAAGYSTLVVTLDTWMLGWRPVDLDRAYLPFLRQIGVANYFADPAFRAGLTSSIDDDPLAAVAHWAGMFSDPATTWQDLEFLRRHWSGPIVLKGILHADDARRARDEGMDGVVVSNHGGRQVDGCVGALDALPGVVRAVGADMTVLFDSGVRTGSDIVKALALGARAVLVGRPYAYGLAAAGEEGVEHVLRCLLAELDLTVALSGHSSVDELTADLIEATTPA